MSRSAVSLYLKFESGLIEGVSPYIVTRKQFKSPEEWNHQVAQLALSKTVYVGNISFFTTEQQLYRHFSLAGRVRKVTMGINKFTKESCGFAFIEYYDRTSAVNARMYLHKTKLDNRVLKVDIDEGYSPGREFGKSSTGGQVRDDVRSNYDSDRGGWSAKLQKMAEQYDVNADGEGQDQQQQEEGQQGGDEQAGQNGSSATTMADQ